MDTLSVRDRRLARRLAALAAELGDQAWTELKPAVDRVLAGAGVPRRKAFLTVLRSDLQRELTRRKAVVEHAGPLSPEQLETIRARFSEQTGIARRAEARSEPSLIGGVRVQVGDNVYDSSIAGRLHHLAAAVK